MGKNTVYNAECLIYPGAYVPLLREEEEAQELKHIHDHGTTLPPVNVTELPDSFKIEVAIPGVKKEDFLIYADGNVLSVYIINKERREPKGKSFQLHEFNYNCFERHITLPYHADTEFIGAEYRAGILHLYVPKGKQLARKQHTRIVVY